MVNKIGPVLGSEVAGPVKNPLAKSAVSNMREERKEAQGEKKGRKN